jgi:hypothetical protein
LEAANYIDIPDLEVVATVTKVSKEAYMSGTLVEYFSATHSKWCRGIVEGKGRFLSEEGMPTYTVTVGSGTQAMRRYDIALSSLRRVPKKDDLLNVFMKKDKRWIRAAMIEAKGVPSLMYCAKVLETGKVCHFPADKVEMCFPSRSEVQVYQGPLKGWVAGHVKEDVEEDLRDNSQPGNDAASKHWFQMSVEVEDGSEEGVRDQSQRKQLQVPSYLVRVPVPETLFDEHYYEDCQDLDL